MSTGSISLDILLNQIKDDAIANSEFAIDELHKRYPSLSEKELREIHTLIASSLQTSKECAELVVTAPPSFTMRTKETKTIVNAMIENASKSILITGYSLSDYFSDMVDRIIKKSQTGVYVKFFVNDIDSQSSFDKLCRYKGKFLEIYNFPKQQDSMAALHAKVISVDKRDNLITSANLSYHGQEGNIEFGTHIESEEIAKQIDDVFTSIILKKVFVKV